MKGLTGKQKKIVEFIREFTGVMGMAPTIYEIAEHFGIKTSTVFAHIRALQKKSVLHRSSKARSISLMKSGKRSRVPAGAQTVPVLDSASLTENPVPGKELICDSRLFSRTVGEKDVFALHVTGSSFEPLGFFDGDMLLLRKPAGSPVLKGDLLLTEDPDGKGVLCSCLNNRNGVCELKTGSAGKPSFLIPQNELPLRGVVIGLQRSM